MALLKLANITAAAPFAYIPNYNSNTTSVMDIANNTVTSTVPVGTNPWGVADSPDGSKVYVASSGYIAYVDLNSSLFITLV